MNLLKKPLKNIIIFKTLPLLILFLSLRAIAQDAVEVPIDELATESVNAVFDNAESVKNRNVNTTGRVDLGFFGGYALTEPIYNTTKYGLAGNYHFNEYHSLGLIFSQNQTGLSRDGEGLRESNSLDFNRAPKPQNSIFLDYNYKPYYGKLSLTKSMVFNTTIYGSASLGQVKYEHKSYPAIGLGLGERFYFTNALSLKLDLRLLIHNAPIPFKSPGLSLTPPADDVPDFNSFDERITYTTNLEVGLNYLF